MPGLLDFLNSDEARLGVGLLAAGGPTTDPNQSGLGQRLAGALQFGDASRASKMREELLRSQMAENDSQAAARQAALARQAQMDNYYLGNNFGAGSTQQAGAVPEGAALKAAVGAPADAPRPAQGKFAEWSQQFKIPVDALVSDYVSNGGKGIAEMLMKRGTPDMQVSNGFAYDKNQLQGGFMPQVNTSSTGQTSLILPNAQGTIDVSAPRGAVDTFRSYQGAQAALKPIKVYNPETGREEFTNEAAVAGGSPEGGGGTLGMRNNNPGNLRPPGQSTGFQQFSTPEQGLQAIDNQLRIYGQRDGINTIRGAISKWAPSNENNTGAYVERVSKMLGVSPDAKIDLTNPYVRQALSTGIMLHENGSQILTGGAQARSGNFAAGPTPAEAASAKAAEAKAVDTAKADVVRDTDTAKKAKSAGSMIAAADRAIDLLKQGPTASGMGEMADKTMAFFGKSNKGADIASKLDIVAGDLVNNVPRMEGPQSDGDRLEYKIQAGRAADRSLPVEQRISAAEEVKRLQGKYARLNGGAPDAGGDSPAGKLKTAPSQADLQNTALKYNMTVDQVKKKLGIQ